MRMRTKDWGLRLVLDRVVQCLTADNMSTKARGANCARSGLSLKESNHIQIQGKPQLPIQFKQRIVLLWWQRTKLVACRRQALKEGSRDSHGIIAEVKVYLVYSPSYRNLLRYAGCKRILVSFGTQKWLPSWRLPTDFSDYMLDSGGYQVAQGTGNRGLYVKSYCYWVEALLNRYGEFINSYMSLDVETEKFSFENQCYMEAHGLNPVPVWHDGWSDELLTHYTENYPYIAIGGLVGQKKSTRYYASLAHKLIFRFRHTKFHFFGMGVSSDAFEKKPYSVDFSTYLNPVKYGDEIVWIKGHLKSRAMDEQSRKRIEHDKEFMRYKIKEAIANLLTLEGK